MTNTPFFNAVLESKANQISVIAGPGSGKTKGIIIPKATALLKAGVDPKEILLLSFSRMSALDLKKRVESLDKSPRASTVHSFCLKFLLSENDHAIRDRIDSILMDFETDFLVHDLKLIFQDLSRPAIKKLIKKFAAGWAVNPHDEVFDEDDEQRKFKAAIVNWLSEHKAAMLGEIVYFGVDHLAKVGKTELLNGIKYIFVDEFQDLNKLEQEFVRILAEGTNLLVIVGDPDQSIYSFKFAWRTGIEQFSESGNVESHTLPFCGRCDTEVLHFANQILTQENPARTVLPMPIEGKEAGSVTRPAPFQSQENEFNYVLDSIKALVDQGVAPKDILILVPKKKLGPVFLSTISNRLNEIEGTEFKLANPPEFTARQREQLLKLALVANPNSLLHTRSFVGLDDPPAGYANEIGRMKATYGSWESSVANANPDNFPPHLARVRRVCDRIIAMKEEIAGLGKLTSQEVIQTLFPIADGELMELNAILTDMCKDGDTPEDIYRKFIDFSMSIPNDDNTVKVMTIMASKGLEAPHVYIIGCNNGNLPGERRDDSHLTDIEYEQEQRRFLYVGVTRAQKSVTITWSKFITTAQAMDHFTHGIGVQYVNGVSMTRVGICRFLQDI